jgi:hypothetical protein
MGKRRRERANSLIHHSLYSPFTLFTMKELIDQLKAEGLSEDQAYKAVEIVKNFAKDKFPIFGGAIDRLFDKYGPKEKPEDDFLD